MLKAILTGLVTLIFCAGSVGCIEPSSSIDRSNFNAQLPCIIDAVPEEVPPLPIDGAMTTVIGPLAVDMDKWGPDQNMPFSWPGRVVQRGQTNPSLPEEQLIYEVRLPENSALQKVHIWVEPRKGHLDVPYSRAQAMVWAHNGGFKTVELIAGAGKMVMPGDSVVNYEQRYLLTRTMDEPFIMTADTRVFIYVFGEWGDDSVMGLAVDTPEIVYAAP